MKNANKRLIDLTLAETLEALRPLIREEALGAVHTGMKDSNDLINRKEAMKILGIADSTMTLWIDKGIITKYGKTDSGEFSKTQCLAVRKANDTKKQRTQSNQAA